MQAEPYGAGEIELTKFRTLAAWRHSKYEDEGDPLRVLHFQRLLREASHLAMGDYVEMGTQHGGTAKIIYDLMVPGAELFCFDTFTGFDAEDLKIESTVGAHGFTTESISDVDIGFVRDMILGDGRTSDRLHLVPGRVPQTLAPFANRRWRFAHLDMDLYEPTKRALEWLWPRLVPGAIVLFHDYDALPSIKVAVDEFSKPKGLVASPLSDRFGSSVLFKPPSAHHNTGLNLRRFASRAKQRLKTIVRKR
jgi:hypothetical protein